MNTWLKWCLGLSLLATQPLLGDALDTWKIKSVTLENAHFQSVIYQNGLLLAITEQRKILRSLDGMTWESINVDGVPTGWNEVTYGDGTFLAVGNTRIATSTDTINWTIRDMGITNSVRSAAFGDGTFVIVGNNGFVATSGDTIHWTRQFVGDALGGSFSKVVRISGRFIVTAVGEGFITSANGTNWDAYRTPPATLFHILAHGNNLYMGVSGKGTIVRSQGFGNWVSVGGFTSVNFNAILFAAGRWVVAGDQGNIWTSIDGINWTGRKSGTTANLRSILYLNDEFLIFGTEGTVLVSGRIESSEPQLTAKKFLGIEIEGSLGRYYEIQRSWSLESPTWHKAATIKLEQPKQVWLDSLAVDGVPRFYRAVELP